MSVKMTKLYDYVCVKKRGSAIVKALQELCQNAQCP